MGGEANSKVARGDVNPKWVLAIYRYMTVGRANVVNGDPRRVEGNSSLRCCLFGTSGLHDCYLVRSLDDRENIP